MQFDAFAYNLRPGIPPEGLSREEAYRGRSYPPGYFERLKEMARESGIEMIKPPVVANTFKAHEVTEFAKEHGRLMEFHRATFSACWERGENVGREDVLCSIAAECGMDADGLRAALADGRYRGRVEEQMDWARAAGVSGVPTFVFFAGGQSASGGNRMFALVGAQEYDVFADVVRRIQSGALT